MPYPDNLLSRGERVVLRKHPHWKVLFFPFLILLLVVAGTSFGFAYTHSNSANWQVWWIAIGVAAVLLLVFGFVVPFIKWRSEHFIVTTRHVFFRTGFFKRREHQIPLGRIQNLEVNVGFWGRILGYGTLTIESAADQPLTFFNVASLPKVQGELNQLIADDRDGTSGLGDTTGYGTGQEWDDRRASEDDGRRYDSRDSRDSREDRDSRDDRDDEPRRFATQGENSRRGPRNPTTAVPRDDDDQPIWDQPQRPPVRPRYGDGPPAGDDRYQQRPGATQGFGGPTGGTQRFGDQPGAASGPRPGQAPAGPPRYTEPPRQPGPAPDQRQGSSPAPRYGSDSRPPVPRYGDQPSGYAGAPSGRPDAPSGYPGAPSGYPGAPAPAAPSAPAPEAGPRRPRYGDQPAQPGGYPGDTGPEGRPDTRR